MAREAAGHTLRNRTALIWIENERENNRKVKPSLKIKVGRCLSIDDFFFLALKERIKIF